MGLFDRVISPGAHFVPGPAQGMSLFVEGNIIRCVFGRFCPPIDINESIDVPILQQFISRDIVMGGVQADVFGSEAKGMTSEIIYGI